MDSAALTSWLNQTSGMSAFVVGAVVLAGLLVGVAPSSLPLYGVVAAISARPRWMPILFATLGVVVIDTMAHYLALTYLMLAAVLLVLGLLARKAAHGP